MGAVKVVILASAKIHRIWPAFLSVQRHKKGHWTNWQTLLPTFLFTVLAALSVAGCGDMVEIQDRDFVLAIGISYQDQEYQVTYSLPDLSNLAGPSTGTEQGSMLRTYRAPSLAEIEQLYNFNSENRLDYRHLQVILLDASICKDPQAMSRLLHELNDNYEISHNALVYYYGQDISELMGMEGVNGSIGEHLKKLDNNNRIQGQEQTKIGALIDCLANERTLFIPSLEYRDNSVAVNGGILFRENHLAKTLSQDDTDFYYIALGRNHEPLLRLSDERLIQLKASKTKVRYKLTEQGPVIRLEVRASAKLLPEIKPAPAFPKAEIDLWIQTQLTKQIAGIMKEPGIDYLNLYERSSYRNRQMWLRYRDRLDEFINDAVMIVSVDIRDE